MMGFTYFENGVARYIEHYNPLPDDEREYRRAKKYYRRPEGPPRGWW